MEVSQTIKGLAVIAILGGIARAAMMPSAYIWGSNSMPELISGFIACILMGIAIIGVHLYQAPKAGLVGFIAALSIAVSCTMTAAFVWNNMLGLMPEDHAYIAALMPINSLLMLAGQIAFGIVAIRARIFPLWSLILFMVYPLIYFLPVVSDLGSAAWGLCFIVFGLRMRQERQSETYSVVAERLPS